MIYVYALLLILVLLIGWMLTVLGGPGNWLMVVAAALYAWLVPTDAALTIGWGVVIALLVLATVGEILEFIAGALGATKGGGSKRGAALAIIGSMVGGVVGVFVGVPIPVLGPVIAAFLFAGLGAFVGAALGELWKGRSLDQSLDVGKAAFWGRILGTMAKTLVGSVMVVIGAVAILI
jgi:uncharacterized protein YqgC (DUF456 family)